MTKGLRLRPLVPSGAHPPTRPHSKPPPSTAHCIAISSFVLTFAVILVTLIGQGLSLPALIRRLRISQGGDDADEELHARLVVTKAALAQIDALAGEDWIRDETVERMRAWCECRKRRLAARAGKIQDQGYEDRSLAYQEMVRLVLAAQREALLGMRRDGKLSTRR